LSKLPFIQWVVAHPLRTVMRRLHLNLQLVNSERLIHENVFQLDGPGQHGCGQMGQSIQMLLPACVRRTLVLRTVVKLLPFQ
jgi:hypothetical protein